MESAGCLRELAEVEFVEATRSIRRSSTRVRYGASGPLAWRLGSGPTLVSAPAQLRQ